MQFFFVAAFETCFFLGAATDLDALSASLTGFGVLAAFTDFFFSRADFLSEVFAPDFADLLFEAAFPELTGLGFDFDATFFLAII